MPWRRWQLLIPMVQCLLAAFGVNRQHNHSLCWGRQHPLWVVDPANQSVRFRHLMQPVYGSMNVSGGMLFLASVLSPSSIHRDLLIYLTIRYASRGLWKDSAWRFLVSGWMIASIVKHTNHWKSSVMKPVWWNSELGDQQAPQDFAELGHLTGCQADLETTHSRNSSCCTEQAAYYQQRMTKLVHFVHDWTDGDHDFALPVISNACIPDHWALRLIIALFSWSWTFADIVRNA